MQDYFLFIYLCILMLSRIGLLAIIVSWLIQLNHSRNGRKELQPAFLILQAIGVFLVMIGSFANGEAFL
ncbi:MAG: hypothetical protein WCG98_09370 [bacterium]